MACNGLGTAPEENDLPRTKKHHNEKPLYTWESVHRRFLRCFSLNAAIQTGLPLVSLMWDFRDATSADEIAASLFPPCV